MLTHELRLNVDKWDAISTGKQRALFRQVEKGWSVGDMLLFREYEPRILKETGRSMAAKITHILTLEEPHEGYNLVSIRLLK